MHSGVFIGSCDVIGIKGEVGLLLWVMHFTLVIITGVKRDAVCVCVCVSKLILAL